MTLNEFIADALEKENDFLMGRWKAWILTSWPGSPLLKPIP